MAYQQQRSKSSIDFSTPREPETPVNTPRSNSFVNLTAKQREEWIKQLEDDSDWEVFSILSGEKSIDDKLFTKVGNENVVLFQSIEEIPRCGCVFDIKN